MAGDTSQGIVLCDCPGLVFPNFATTNAELVCNGVLPIDQLREWTGPAGLLARRIPKKVLEQVYSFRIYARAENDVVTGEELLVSFACSSSD
jgi:large subunit GTPase 1